jgi:hypothetical protein
MLLRGCWRLRRRMRDVLLLFACPRRPSLIRRLEEPCASGKEGKSIPSQKKASLTQWRRVRGRILLVPVVPVRPRPPSAPCSLPLQAPFHPILPSAPACLRPYSLPPQARFRPILPFHPRLPSAPTQLGTPAPAGIAPTRTNKSMHTYTHARQPRTCTRTHTVTRMLWHTHTHTPTGSDTALWHTHTHARTHARPPARPPAVTRTLWDTHRTHTNMHAHAHTRASVVRAFVGVSES